MESARTDLFRLAQLPVPFSTKECGLAPRRYLGRSHLGAAGTWVHRDPFKALLGPLEAGPPVPVGISVECSDTLPPHCAWCEEVPACQPPASPRGNVAAWNRDLPHSPDPWQTCPRIFLHPRESPGSPPPPRLQAKRVSGRLGTFGSPLHPARNVFQLREVALSVALVGGRGVSLTVSPPLSHQPPTVSPC